jgi:hypothetical protein
MMIRTEQGGLRKASPNLFLVRINLACPSIHSSSTYIAGLVQSSNDYRVSRVDPNYNRYDLI